MLRPYQTKAIESIRQLLAAGKKRIVIVLPTGAGKCLGYGTKVIMSDGGIRDVQDIKPFDMLMGIDSKPRTVLSICSGIETMYKIIPLKGDSWNCNESHILSLVCNARNSRYKYKEIINISVKEYLLLPKSVKHVLKLYKSTGVEFPKKEIECDPYILGLWLGDGHADSGRITNVDYEVIEALKNFANNHNFELKKYKDKRSNAITFWFSNNNKSKRARNPLTNFLSRIGILNNKRIPVNYLRNTRNIRLSILAGIIDSDGHYAKKGYEICVLCTDLKDDIVYLCRSLGFNVSINPKKNWKGYRLYISGEKLTDIPILIERKKAEQRKQIKDALRTQFRIENVGIGNYYGFTLDSDGLFLLGDFTVTHNTTIASEIIKRAKAKNKKSIFVAHRQELVYQAHERLAQFGIDAGIIMPPHKANGHNVHVASVQTLVRRQHPPADIVFVDETHHINSASYKRILENYKNAFVFGLTATPFRSDGKPLGEIFEDIIAPVSVQELIDQNFLVRPQYFGAKQDFSDIKIVRGDYDNKQLFEKVDKKILYDGVVEKFKQFGHGKTLVFCVNVQHSKNTCETFSNAGFAAAHLDADTDTPTRQRVLKEFAEGKWQILCNVAILTEGFNLPTINTIVLNRATKSKGLYFQIVGRGLRTAEGKENCIIIDHGNNVFEHGPVEADQDYDIHQKKKKKKSTSTVQDQVKECPICFSLIGKRTQICYHCGYQFPPSHKIVESEFEEIKIKKVVIPPHLRKPWSRMTNEELEEYRALKGYKKGWKHYVKKARRDNYD